SVKKTANVVYGRRPWACRSSVSTPRMSSLGKTATVAAGFGMLSQLAIASEAGTRSNLDGFRLCASRPCASAAAWLNMNVKPRVAIASKRRRLVVKLFLDCMDCIVLVRFEVELFMTEL